MKDSDNVLNVRRLVALCDVSPSGYYNWLAKTKENTVLAEAQDQEDFKWILKAYQFRGYPKGYRPIYMILLQWDIVMNMKKILRLMRKYNLHCPIRRKSSYKVARSKYMRENVAPNHVRRQFKAYGPRVILLTDITYIRYGRGNTAYINTVKDA
ncbi:hypothetical protein C7B66_21050, partial [Bacillus halotolerans]